MTESFEQWIEREYRYAARAMLRSISPTGLVKTRPGFGQTVRAAEGAVVGSPVLASWDPDPDYFFHWFRDSALIIDALRLLHEDGMLGAEALAHLAAFVRFSASLNELDGRVLAGDPAWRARVAPDFRRFLREEAELAAVRGEAVLAETRVNPDGTLDFSKWSRPQNDGAALRALSLLRWLRGARLDAAARAQAAALLRTDLAFSCRHARRPCYDIWEEEFGLHYYTLRVSAAALEAGAAWLEGEGDAGLARAYRDEAGVIGRELDGFWLADEGYYRSRMLSSGARSTKELDVSVILAALHADAEAGTHSVRDPRMQATLARLEALFDARYPINRRRAAHARPALGRYEGDVYFGGGAWYLATLGAAEFCFRAAANAGDAQAWAERGDGFLTTVRAYTPDSGELSEQFDPDTGAQKSARDMPWSYAAFISCVAARRSPGGTRPP